MEQHPLRVFRRSLGMTQAQFAERIGCAPAYVCQIELRREEMGRATGLAIVEAFRRELAEAGLSLETLLRGYEQDNAA